MSILTTRKVRNMKTYDVTLNLTVNQKAEDVIEADSEEQAKEIAEANYDIGEYDKKLRSSTETEREDYYAQEKIEVRKCPVCEKVYEEFNRYEDDSEDRKTNTYFQRVKDYLGATNKA